MTVLAILKPFAPIRTGFLTRMQDDKSENNVHFMPKLGTFGVALYYTSNE